MPIMSAKNASLLAGMFQQTMLVLIIRYSKTSNHNGDNVGPSYLNSVAVASAEVFKLCLSFVLEFINSKKHETNRKGGRISHLRSVFKPMLLCNDKESIKLIVPALLYLIQNNLLFVALANLSVGMYQVTNQGKLLTTALLSRIMLKKHISSMQYLSIAILGFGVALIHLSDHHAKKQTDTSAIDTETGQNHLLGLIAVLICCVTSSFSGVYFEFILKKSPNQLSVHCRNFHLASWSLLFAIFHILFEDFAQVKEYGLFHGFDMIVVLIVIAQGMTGFVVSMMIKYASAVLKGFAISVSAVFATLLSVPLFGASISPSFAVAASMVVIAAKMYSHYDVKPDVKTERKTSESTNEGAIEEKDEELMRLVSKGEDDSSDQKSIV
mmetsp:Transcript_24684/g.53246  ORF Transcript_24684/g.53246 Transcript_24684/m.53246 type:complete len:382 (-) Transcript_24684:41-1186(-)